MWRSASQRRRFGDLSERVIRTYEVTKVGERYEPKENPRRKHMQRYRN